MGTNWFEALTGFKEAAYADVQRVLVVKGHTLRSPVNGQAWGIGRLETPSLGELRERAIESFDSQLPTTGAFRVTNVSGDVGVLHQDVTNRGALFQVASQFNLLEMTGPDVTPEHGVTRYAHDHTQGPACAIAAGAATIYRNYFAHVDGHIGQTRTRQIDCLKELGTALGNSNGSLWTMRNGYAMCTEAGLVAIGAALRAMPGDERDAVRDRLRIGLHWNVEVTSGGRTGQHVSQAFCSALPVAYAGGARELWAPFATLVLEGAYEATLWAGVLNGGRGGSSVVFLTHLGGGAFGNDRAWIDAAMHRALTRVKDAGAALDVRLVSYGAPDPASIRLAQSFT